MYFPVYRLIHNGARRGILRDWGVSGGVRGRRSAAADTSPIRPDAARQVRRIRPRLHRLLLRCADAARSSMLRTTLVWGSHSRRGVRGDRTVSQGTQDLPWSRILLRSRSLDTPVSPWLL